MSRTLQLQQTQSNTHTQRKNKCNLNIRKKLTTQKLITPSISITFIFLKYKGFSIMATMTNYVK